MSNATLATKIEAIKNVRDARIMEAMLENFYKAWAPEDKYEAQQFAVELHMLFRQIYREAQEPCFKQLNAIISALPFPIVGLDK